MLEQVVNGLLLLWGFLMLVVSMVQLDQKYNSGKKTRKEKTINTISKIVVVVYITVFAAIVAWSTLAGVMMCGGTILAFRRA